MQTIYSKLTSNENKQKFLGRKWRTSAMWLILVCEAAYVTSIVTCMLEWRK